MITLAIARLRALVIILITSSVQAQEGQKADVCSRGSPDSHLTRLIALLLGRLRLPIQKAIELYIEFAGRVFGKPQRLAKLSLFGFRLVAYKYSAKHFEEVIKDALKKNCGEKADEFELMQDGGDPDIRRCMT